MIRSANGVISTEQPESEHVHSEFPCVAYHQHFDANGAWMSCPAAKRYVQDNMMGRVLKNSGASEERTGMPVNPPR